MTIFITKIFLILVGDGRIGWAEEGPYDAIHVGAAASDIPKAVKKAFFFLF